jgi:hypothetical protein
MAILYTRLPDELRRRLDDEQARRGLAHLSATVISLLTERLDQIDEGPAGRATANRGRRYDT